MLLIASITVSLRSVKDSFKNSHRVAAPEVDAVDAFCREDFEHVEACLEGVHHRFAHEFHGFLRLNGLHALVPTC
jgi:hypothetical protein